MRIKIIALILLIISPYASYARRGKNSTLTLRDSIITEATRHIGKRYQYAGKGPNRFDCSGFTGYVFRQFGYELYASSASQYLQGEKTKLENAQKGDLIFFKGSNSKSKGVGHVGIIYDVNEDGKNTTLQFIHASVNKGITIDNYPESDYYRIRFIGIRRIIGENERKEQYPTDTDETSEEEETQEITPPNQEEEPQPEPVEEKEEKKEKRKPDPQEEPSEPQKEEPAAPTEALCHIVKRKETLFKIAKKYDCTVKDLMEWNHLKNTYLKIGQSLYVTRPTVQDQEKNRKEEPTPQEEEKKEPTPVATDTITHTVQPKETLYRLSKQYGCSVEDIQRWNHLKGNALKIGQTLIILKRADQ